MTWLNLFTWIKAFTNLGTSLESVTATLLTRCKYVHIKAKTTISIQASQRLSMLVYYLRHQERTSSVTPKLTDVLIMDIEALDHHWTMEEDWARTHRDPDPTPMTLDNMSAAKAFNQMRQILTNMCDMSKALLAYVIRKRILPPDAGH